LRKKTIKKLCTVRWESRHNALFSLKQRFLDILKALTNIELVNDKKDEVNIAQDLKKKLESVEFVILLIIWEKILKSLFIVSKFLQSININLQQACKQLEKSYIEIEK